MFVLLHIQTRINKKNKLAQYDIHKCSLNTYVKDSKLKVSLSHGKLMKKISKVHKSALQVPTGIFWY